MKARVMGWKAFRLSMVGGGKREGRLLVLRGEDGREGVGECSPLRGWSRETLEDVDDFVKEARGEDEWRELAERGGLPAALQFAWECAEADWGGGLVGEVKVNPLPLNALLVGGAKAQLRRGVELYEKGFRVFKIKTAGLGVGEIVFVLKGLREACGRGVELRLDSNRSWEWEDAEEVAERVEEFGVAYWEEPLRERGRLREWVERGRIPVALDETVREIALGDLREYRGAWGVVLKPSLLGGLRVARGWAQEAEKNGMRAVVSASYESGWGIYWLGQLACRMSNAGAAGLDTYSFLEEDLLRERLELGGGYFFPERGKPELREVGG